MAERKPFSSPLVSVIIPAYEARATLPRTLQSVLAQTHRNLEVLVVDDGSRDNTAQLAEQVSAADSRIRLFRRANGGVAAARNLGIEMATGEFIAPLDADDVWHPRKLELQLERFAQSDRKTGLVYNWFRMIDGEDRVRGASPSPRVEGMCLHRHLAYNFISNGSTPLMRREAIGNLRYDPRLKEAGAGGCEDYLLQLQIARHWKFALVPAWLTGYRKTEATMSSDVARMIRSHIAVLEMMREELGLSAQTIIRRRLTHLHVEYFRNRFHRGLIREAGAALRSAIRQDAVQIPPKCAYEAVALVRRAIGRERVSQPFDHYEFDEHDDNWPYKLQGYMARLKVFDDRVQTAGLLDR